MPDPSLYIFMQPFSLLWLDLPDIFSNMARPGKGLPVCQHSPITEWQRKGAVNLGVYLTGLADPAITGNLRKSYSSGLERNYAALSPVKDGGDRIWILDPVSPQGIALLKEWLSSLPDLARYKVKPCIIASRQDAAFRQWGMLGWGHTGYPDLAKIASEQDRFLNYEALCSAMTENFQRCEFIDIAYDPATQRLPQSALDKIASFLSLPGGFFQPRESCFPIQSFAGLDLHGALRAFPFTRGGRCLHDRHAINRLIGKVEREENYRIFAGLPREFTDPVMREAEVSNARLAEKLGRPIFQDHPVYCDIPDSGCDFPAITTEQARPFIAAMDEKLRRALLDYFRNFPGEMTSAQKAVARGIENYQARENWLVNIPIKRPEPKLSILTMTRNHKSFIMDCMESVGAQKTDFPVEHIIVDDNSDDGTQDIIEDYALSHPHVRPIYMPCQSVTVRTLFNACKSEYAALCDGDDYFTDPEKLQRQINFLEANKDCSLCFHPVHVKFENDRAKDFVFPPPNDLPRGVRDKYYLADLIQANFIQTNSVVYRWRFRDGLPDWFRDNLCPGDWYWHLLHAEIGKIGFIPRIMSVYRRHAAAMYSAAFLDRKKHFAEHGMSEISTINHLNEHFKGRYFKHLANLADAFFISFYESQLENPQSRTLEEACRLYPQFGAHFLKNLSEVRKTHPAKSD